MSSGMIDEIVESNNQCNEMWREFARRFPESTVDQLPGIDVSISGTPMSFVNVMGFSSPVRDREDLAERCRRVIQIGQKGGVPWLLSACDAWIGDPEMARMTLAEFKLAKALRTTGMVADKILPAKKPLPPEIEIRRANDEASHHALVDLNTLAYGIPQEVGRQGPGRECFWDDSFHGYVAYLHDQPVACTVTAAVDGRLYVSWVATHPDHRRKGYADAVMRKSLESAALATGLSRTVLHATEAGRPVYEAMGYRSVVGFTWYAYSPEG